MRLRVGTFERLVYQDREYSGGETFDVPDDVADNFLATGLVVPADDAAPADTDPA